MGGGSDSSQSTQQTNSQSVTQLPPWINQAAQQNYALAQNISNRPLTQYQGQLTPDVSPQTQAAWNSAAGSANAGQPAYDASQAGYLGVLGSTPMNVTGSQASLANPVTAAQAATAQAAAAQQAALASPTNAATANLSQLSNTNLQPYLNPYTQDVINKTLPIMQQSLANQQNALQNQANQTNAFGGSRQGIQQGVLGAQGAMGMGQMAAQLNQANFQQAQQAGEFDVSAANNMGQFNANQLNQVGMYNQGQANQVGMYNAGQGNQVALQNAAMANAANQFNAGQSNQVNLADMSAANQMGQFNAAAQQQAALANQAAQQNQGQLNLSAASGLSALGAQAQRNQLQSFGELTAAGQQQQQMQQAQIDAQQNKFNQAWNYPYQQLGVLQSALSQTPYGTAQQGQSTTNSQTEQQTNPGMLNSIFSGLQTAGSLLPLLPGGSDRRLKTDIKKVDTHPSGLPIYAYRYKGDPKSYAKVMGPMAEDVAKVAPQAVQPMGVGGRLAIDMSKLPQGLPGPPGMGAMPRIPGPLAAPGAIGQIGPLGSPMTGRPPRRMGKTRFPPVRGALSGG